MVRVHTKGSCISVSVAPTRPFSRVCVREQFTDESIRESHVSTVTLYSCNQESLETAVITDGQTKI
eukprot:1196083-Prorocentrum_minimum.AAC.6